MKATKLNKKIDNSWSKISPSWPLRNIIAVNPLLGFIAKDFEESLREAKAFFQKQDLPKEMDIVNRESIKWLQVYFDEGQATIKMPNRNFGFLKSILSMMCFDDKLHNNNPEKISWIKNLPENPEEIIIKSLDYLGIAEKDQELFLSLLLTSLNGWASYIQYYTSWSDEQDKETPRSVTKNEYLAFRLIITCLVWKDAKFMLDFHKKAHEEADISSCYSKIVAFEESFQKDLVKKIKFYDEKKPSARADAQMVFCIDVRSEPFRKAIESQGNYETFGFAGFFGLPISVENSITEKKHTSCPVLLKPSYNIVENVYNSDVCKEGYKKFKNIKKIYQSLKFTFTTPFGLAETLGFFSGVWSSIRTFSPRLSYFVKKSLRKYFRRDYIISADYKSISLKEQIEMSAAALKTMDLKENFAPLVILCGHGSKTQNNAYATSLDCGACGGNNGAPNARVLSAILNSKEVRVGLRKFDVKIPEDTLFVAAEHNTTTDELEIFDQKVGKAHMDKLSKVKDDIEKARLQNNIWRGRELGENTNAKNVSNLIENKAKDWAEVRPEWGLARNAAFIVAPRDLTKNINLKGRAFLHSYNWKEDVNFSLLEGIMTAPMIVGQWINSQYLFSTIDNTAFGSGSKITHNICGKIGVMQGNASDLMNGLPLQSLFISDREEYHEAVRLTVIIYAPKDNIVKIIKKHELLQNLFKNGWLHLICMDPESEVKLKLSRDLSWNNFS